MGKRDVKMLCRRLRPYVLCRCAVWIRVEISSSSSSSCISSVFFYDFSFSLSKGLCPVVSNQHVLSSCLCQMSIDLCQIHRCFLSLQTSKHGHTCLWLFSIIRYIDFLLLNSKLISDVCFKWIDWQISSSSSIITSTTTTMTTTTK